MTLRPADDDALRVATSASLTFGVSEPRHTVVLQALADAPPGVTQLRAAVEQSPANLADAAFVDGELPVNVITEREFTWVFRAAQTQRELPEAVVDAGMTTRLRVSLADARGVGLLAGEQVVAALTTPAGMTVNPATLTLSADAMSQEVDLMAGTNAMPGTLRLQVTQTTPDPLPRATVAPTATLPVRVGRLALVFTTLADEPLEMVRVLAGGATAVRVRLANAGALFPGEKVQVALTPEALTVDVAETTLTAQTPEAIFTIEAAHDVTSLLGRVMASGVVLRSDDSEVARARVISAALPVEVVARRFRLELGGRSYVRKHSPGLRIRVNTRSLTVFSTITVVEDITIEESFWVAVSIRHPYRGRLRVDLDTPHGYFRLKMTSNFQVNADNLRRVYTAESGPLDELIGKQARGEWVLGAGDYTPTQSFLAEGGLERWGIGFGPPVQVFAGASTLVTARLVGVETPLGSPRLVAGEIISVANFAYPHESISGEAVVAMPFVFTAATTAVGMTLTAPVNAPSVALYAEAASLSANLVVERAAWPVRVVAREFTLSFVTPAGEALNTARVPARDSLEMVVRLSGVATSLGSPSLAAGETFMLALTYAEETSVVAVASPPAFFRGQHRGGADIDRGVRRGGGDVDGGGRW